ncbi:MAG: phosphate ABC transporter permease subunit PstC [Gemmataceae bacterium]
MSTSRLQRPSVTMGLGDTMAHAMCLASALGVLAIAAGLVAVLVERSLPAIQATGLRFFASAEWDPNAVGHDDDPPPPIPGLEDVMPTAPTGPAGPPKFGALAFVFGTAASSFLAMLLAVPLGVGAAAYLAEIASPRVRKLGSSLVVLLAAVPSVVYGFWGWKALAPLLQRMVDVVGGPNFGGLGLFPAGVVLGIMILPYVCAVSYDVCRAVPASQREAALALGATRWQMISSVVLVNAKRRHRGGVLPRPGPAARRDDAVTILIGNNPVISLSPFAKAATISSVIANELPNALNPLHRSALVELALVLFGGTLALNATAVWMLGRAGPSRPGLMNRLFGRLRLSGGGPARARVVDKIMSVVLAGCLVASVVPLFSILGEMTVRGVSALNWALFTELPKPPFEQGGGLGHAMLGSLMLVTVATLIAVPVGVLTAVYLAEYRPGRFGAAIRFTVDALNGVPSIVIGIFAYVLVVQYGQRLFGLDRPRFFGWSGAFALAVIMIPVVVRTTEESLRQVPTHLRHGSYALGATHWQTTSRVVLPAALPGILTGTILSVARIFGETAPLLLTAGVSRFWPDGLSGYVPSLPYAVFDYIQSTDPNQVRQAWGGAFVLLALVLVLIVGVRAVSAKFHIKRGFD